MEIQLKFQTRVSAPISEVWKWITSRSGISKEMWPYFRMTFPRGVNNLQDVKYKPGDRLFRSKIYLFGFLPFGHDDMTLISLTEGQGFIEESPMTFMKLWRHERSLTSSGNGTVITDQITFEPRYAMNLAVRFMKQVFTHRHEVLRQNLESNKPA